MTILVGVCLKLIDRRPAVDGLSGVVRDDPRSAGMSDADRAALEWALRVAELWNGEVLAVTAGPAEADAVLREALGAGATGAVRVHIATSAPSEVVASALAPVLGGCHLVWCGDYSLDRGSGSVPAYLAAHLGAVQALGLVAIQPEESNPGTIIATRRLDGGRRERVRIVAPAVLSVEGSVARLRRASLTATIGARAAPIEVRPGPEVTDHIAHTTRPYRPRARALPAPTDASARERIMALVGTSAPSTSGHPIKLDPPEAAARILTALVEWGYLEPDGIEPDGSDSGRNAP